MAPPHTPTAIVRDCVCGSKTASIGPPAAIRPTSGTRATRQTPVETDAAETRRREQLAERREAHQDASSEAISQAREYNEGIDMFARDFRSSDSESVARFCTLVLDSSAYPDAFPHQTWVIYRPKPREMVVEWELPPQSVIPVEHGYRYVARRDAIDPVARPEREIKERYASLIARVTLRTIHEVLVSTPPSVVDAVTFYPPTIPAPASPPDRCCST